MNKTKILIVDIETTPSLGYVWQMFETDVIKVVEPWYMLSFAYKWHGESKTHVYSLPMFEGYQDNLRDDKQLVTKLWELFEEADVIMGHNCVEINTPILKQDLTWVKAGELNTGDKIVGFEEATIPNETLRDKAGKWRGTQDSVRRIKPATVTEIMIEKRECYEVLLSNGDKIITTGDHYWLGKTKNDNFYKWIQTKELKQGYRFTKFWNVWKQDESYEAGWLSGFIAGEGSLGQSGRSFAVNFYQRPGSTWNQALEYCDKLNIPYSLERTQRATGIGRQDTLATGLLGGKFKITEYIGRLNIKRFIEKIDWENFGGLKGKNTETVYVVSVTNVGVKEVAVMSTDTKTFFAGGYAMHNCDRFDIKKSNAKFIEHGLNPPSPYKSIDTLKVARKHFKFDSNRLDALGEYLGVGRKVKTGGFDLWDNCMHGNLKAWKLMEKYNKQDVDLLERVYLKLRPWINNHPNLNLLNDTTDCCPNCGSSNLQRRGYAYTRTNKYQRYQCQNCFSWHQSSLNNIIK